MTCLHSTTRVQKKPEEVLNVSMDFSPWLTGSETLENPSVSVTPPDEIAVTFVTVNGQSVEFKVGDGEDGTTYTVEVTVETSDEEILIGDGKLIVRS